MNLTATGATITRQSDKYPSSTATVSHRFATACAVVTTAGLAGASFVLSFAALADLAHRAGQPAKLAWVWPLIVDGTIVQATVALIHLSATGRDSRRARAYFWAVLAIAASVSVVGNALHAAVSAASGGLSPAVAAGVAAVAPVSLLAATHGIAVLADPQRGRAAQPTGHRSDTLVAAATPGETDATVDDPTATETLTLDAAARDARVYELDAQGLSTRQIADRIRSEFPDHDRFAHSTVARILLRAGNPTPDPEGANA